MKNCTKILLNNAAAVLLGALLTFAFAPYEIFPLAVLAPAGLIALLINTPTPKKSFWLGFAFGLGLFGTGVYWVYNSIHDIGGVPTFLSVIITAAMVSALSVYPALVCYFTNRYFPLNNTTKIVCAFPGFWILSEIFRGVLFSGFPWLFIGYSQTNSPLIGFASILSVYGVSLAVLLTSSLLINIIIKYRQKDFKNLYFSCMTIVAIWTAGGLFALIPWTKPQGEPIPVALVQGNIPQLLKWSPEHLQLSFDRYQELSQPLWGKDKLIIWPEAAIPVPLQYATRFISSMNEQAISTGSNLILGIPIKAEDKEGFYNSVIALGNGDQPTYNKRRLVPFGEYTPMQGYLAQALKFMELPMSEDVMGDANQAPFIVGNTKIHMSVCYEIAFPQLMRTTDKTIGLLLTVTNDAWFGRSNAQAQHLQMAAMRAAELARPALFVSNDGITAIISPKGKIVAAAPAHEATVLTGTVQPMFGVTPWMHNGMDPIVFIVLCLFYWAIRFRKKASSNNNNATLITPTVT